MKKLLGILSALGLVATSSLGVVACGTNENVVDQSLDEVIKEFQKEINDIVNNHISENNKNFFIVDSDNNRKMKFFTKQKFESYMGELKLNKADDSIRNDIIEDFNNMFKVDELKEKINNLQKLEKYSIILNNIGSVFKDITLSSNDKIYLESREPSTSKGVWFGITKFEFSISVNFKNKSSQLEEYKISDVSRTISLTDNEKVGGDIQEFYNEIGQTFIKSEISRISSNKLILKDKTYLENVDNEILTLLNNDSFSREFIQLVQKEFEINVSISSKDSFENLKTDISYRENAIDLDDKSIDKITEYYNLFFRESGSLSKIIDETYEVSNKYINEKIMNSLNNLEAKLGEQDEMQQFINATLKYLNVNLTKLKYEVEENSYVDIPDLNLNFGLFKDSKDKDRVSLDKDIIKNVNLAKEEFSRTYQTKLDDKYLIKEFPEAIISFKDKSQIIRRWIYDDYPPTMQFKKGTNNINDYTNLNYSHLIDYKNQFLNRSKQKNFKFDVSWEVPNGYDSEIANDRIARDMGGKNIYQKHLAIRTKSEEGFTLTWKTTKFNLVLGLDYLNFNFKYFLESISSKTFSTILLFTHND
ncbi:lipoprotein [Spiroplasma endosymbiont of Dioctria linearis]|uniref:lipoprotein n=1 Tax=Spiroplasma endosymbiont of Dioctria linearis TaxID=3066290 RepID=UPI00313F1A6B